MGSTHNFHAIKGGGNFFEVWRGLEKCLWWKCHNNFFCIRPPNKCLCIVNGSLEPTFKLNKLVIHNKSFHILNVGQSRTTQGHLRRQVIIQTYLIYIKSPSHNSSFKQTHLLRTGPPFFLANKHTMQQRTQHRFNLANKSLFWNYLFGHFTPEQTFSNNLFNCAWIEIISLPGFSFPTPLPFLYDITLWQM